MDSPDIGKAGRITQTYVAPQRGVPRGRGPHPLPLFLAHVSKACAGDPRRLQRVLAGLRRYQEAPPVAPRPVRPVAAMVAGVALRDHGGNGPAVVVVPSLINPPSVLDLAEGNSLLAGLVARGLRVLSVDWGVTEPMGLAAIVETRLVPLLAGLEEPVALVGYCLGGTLAVAAAALAGGRVSRLGLLATPWHFAGYGAARAGLVDWWRRAEPLAEALEALPMDLLQPAFWGLDSELLAAKFERFATADADAVAGFVALEDWSSAGQPLSLAAARELAGDLFTADLPGRGEWRVGGATIDPGALAMPVLDVIAVRDRIVPAAAALTVHGPGTPLVLPAGHVGMIVGSRAPAMLWDPLAAWLRGD